MRRLVLTAILALTAACTSASAQVYGTNDNPYETNPFASNMVVDPTPSPPANAAATPPAAQAQTPQDSGKSQQQTAASSAGQETKKPSSP